MTDVQYVFRHEPQNAPRTAQVDVPEGFAKALHEQWTLVQRDQVNPVIDFPTAKDAAFHLAYAKQWGREQTPQVTIRKGTLRKDDQEGTLRLLMTPFDESAPKRGRKPKSAE